LPKGWRVPLVYRREGKRQEILVRLVGLHSERDLIEKAMGRPPVLPGPKPEPDDKPAPHGPRPILPRLKPKPPPKHDMPGPPPDPEDPGPHGRPATPMPEIVKKHFAERRGYANYSFNQLQRDRVLAAWRAKFGPGAGDWTIAARSAAGSSAVFQASAKGVALKAGQHEWQWRVDPPGENLDPPASGGLLKALYLWHSLAVDGPKAFDDVYYLGTAPLAGSPGLVDVLVASKAGAETRFYFDSQQGQLLALEMSPADDVDPCEVYFRDYGQAAGQSRPQTMEVRFGDVVFGVFELEWKHR
jgi:hypothetical protein